MAQSMYWTFTLFGEGGAAPDDAERAEFFDHPDVTYCVIGDEICPVTGKPHWQGYIEFNSRKRLAWLKDQIHDKAHWEKRFGTSEEAANYCKKDGHFQEKGTLSVSDQGKRNDLVNTYRMIKDGADLLEIADRYPGTCMRYLGNIKSLINLQYRPINVKLEVHYIYGASGSGKTSSVVNLCGDKLYTWYDSEKTWFDGLQPRRHPYLLIDEFNGANRPVFYNKMLDRYQPTVEVKGGMIKTCFEKIYICSNYTIDQVATAKSWTEEEVAQFKRRITKIHHVVRLPGADPVNVFAPIDPAPLSVPPTRPHRPDPEWMVNGQPEQEVIDLDCEDTIPI